jgi:hypothetical protein
MDSLVENEQSNIYIVDSLGSKIEILSTFYSFFILI